MGDSNSQGDLCSREVALTEIEEALTTYLLAQPGLTALIDRRLNPDETPQGTALPYVELLNISDVKDHTYGAQSNLESPMFQFTTYAVTKLAAKAIGKQIKAALQDYSGTISGVVVQYIKLANELNTKGMSPDGITKAYINDLEFEINFERS